MPIIIVDKVSKTYPNGSCALQAASLSIREGEFIGLLGRNGAGKSTLIQCLAGVLNPSKGNVTLNINNGSEIAWVNQAYSIDWLLSVEDNVRLGARLGGCLFKKSNSITADALKTMDLFSQAKQMPEMLSGGQQKRLQVARALAQHPKIYLLDEPTTGLDVQAAENFFAHLLSLNKKKAACLVATHELDLLEHFATRIIMLRQGKILDDLSTNDFINKYSKKKMSLKEAFKNAELTTQ